MVLICDENIEMDFDQLERIKKLAIIALFVDDDLMDTLVLKGGNALDIVYKIAPRASIDLDLSIENEFDSTEIDSIRNRIEQSLRLIYNENDYEVFDVTLVEKPAVLNNNTPHFWGGYQLEFKVISREKYSKITENIQSLRRNAEVVGPHNRRKLRVDISKHEYCAVKNRFDLDGYNIYVYPPELIVIEKLRAICQQTEEYCKTIGKSHREARARDFFDIHTVLDHFEIDLTARQNIDLVKRVFAAKEVPLFLIARISDSREFHRSDFKAVEDTVKPKVKIKDFDYYFDFVVHQCGFLAEALGII